MSNEITQDQVALAARLNEVLSQTSEIQNDINRSITNQTSQIAQIVNGLDAVTLSFARIEENFRSINESLEAVQNINVDFLGDFFNRVTTATSNLTTIINSQVTSANNLSSQVSSVTEGVAESSASVAEQTSTASQDIAEAVDSQALAQESASNSVTQGATATQEVANAVEEVEVVTVGLLDVIKQRTRNLLKGLPQLVAAAKNFVSGMIGTLADLTKAVMTLPFTIAQVAANLGGELRKTLVEVVGQAVEDAKEKFDLSSYIGENIKKIGQASAGLISAFQNPTSELVKLFGFGEEGMRNYINSYVEMMDNLGEFSEVFAGEINKNAASYKYFIRMKKGLGLSGEDLKYLAMDSYNNVKSLKERLSEVAHVIISTADHFDIDRKRLSKNFMTLRKDIVLFGSISDEKLAQTTVYMTKMKVNMEDAAAVFNKFSTFEDAANSVAILSQTFGMNLNALDMINAESPDEIMQMFHDSMLATGRTFSDLSRFEKSIMAQHTGMSAESLQTLMNYKASGLTFEEARKAMAKDKPEKQQLAALKEVRSAIKELKKVLNFDSFWDALFGGLEQNISLSGKTKELFMTLSKGYEGLFEYAKNMPKDSVMKILEPIRHVITIMNELFSNPKFISTIESILNTFGDLVSISFGVNNDRVQLKKIERALERSSESDTSDLKNSLESALKSYSDSTKTKTDIEYKLPKGFKNKVTQDPLKALRELQEINKGNKEFADDLAKKIVEQNASVVPAAAAESVTEGLTNTVDSAGDALSKVGSLSSDMAGMIVRGLLITSTAVVNTLNKTLTQFDTSSLGESNLISLLTNIPPKELEGLWNGLLDAISSLFDSEKANKLGSIAWNITSSMTILFGKVAWFFGEILSAVIKGIFQGDQTFSAKGTSSYKEASVYQMMDKEQANFKLTSGGFNYKNKKNNENLTLKDASEEYLKDYMRALRIFEELVSKNYYDENIRPKNAATLEILKKGWGDRSTDLKSSTSVIEHVNRVLNDNGKRSVEYKRSSSLDYVRSYQEELDKKSNSKANGKQGSITSNDFSGAIPGLTSFFGRDDKPLGINDFSSVLQGQGGGIVSSILGMTNKLTDDAVEIESLVKENYNNSKINKNDKKAEAISRVREANAKLKEAIANFKVSEDVVVTPVLDVDDLRNIATGLLDIRVNFNQMSSNPRYCQGGMQQSADQMISSTQNTADYSASRRSYFKQPQE